MTSPRINRTYTASGGTVPAYPYRGELSASREARWGIDLRGFGVLPTAVVIGAGSPIRTEQTDCAHRERSHRSRSSIVTGNRAEEQGSSRRNVCANTQHGRSAIRIAGTGTSTTRMNGWPVTMTSRKQMPVIPDNKKARCANTGLLQEVSLVVTVRNAFGIRSDRRQTA